ncbi:hypothetical protein ACHQM5_022281 [Ranunculus cassubicifolius]
MPNLTTTTPRFAVVTAADLTEKDRKRRLRSKLRRRRRRGAVKKQKLPAVTPPPIVVPGDFKSQISLLRGVYTVPTVGMIKDKFYQIVFEKDIITVNGRRLGWVSDDKNISFLKRLKKYRVPDILKVKYAACYYINIMKIGDMGGSVKFDEKYFKKMERNWFV